MDYCVSEVFPSSAINDAVLIPLFYEEHDALALSKGNHLVIYTVEGEYVSDPKSFEIYGTIEKLIPISYSNALKSNLLIILTDLRTCILKTDDNDPNHLITVSFGTFQNSWNSSRTPIRYAIHPTCLIIQLENFQLDLYPITSNCTLDNPFKIKIGRKNIIGFQFIGPASKVTRLAVLTEEYNTPPMIHLFEIDLTNRSYSEDPSFDVTLNDAYFMIPYDIDEHSIVVVFSTQQATRVMYNELIPYTKTATIFTLDRLIKMIALTTEFHLAIDQANKLHAVNIKEVGEVNFVKIGNVPQPSELVAITPNLAFVASAKDDSVFLTINQENNTYNASIFDSIQSTGQIIKFREFNNSIISIYERAIVESKMMCEYYPFLQIECPGFLQVFSFYFDGKSSNCFAFSDEFQTLIMGENIDSEFIDLSSMFDLSSPSFLFYALGKNCFLQVTNERIWIYRYNEITQEMQTNCTFLQIGDSKVSKASQHGNTISILTSNNTIYFYDILITETENETESANKNENMENESNNDNNIEEEASNYHENAENDNNENEENDINENREKDNNAEDENNKYLSYEIMKRDQTIVENHQISSIAIANNIFVTSSFSQGKISIYHFQDGNFVLVKSIEIGPIIDLAFHNGSLYALSPTEKVTIIQPNFNTLTVLNCPGRHSSIRPINDNTIIICGPDPSVIFGYGKIYPLKVKKQILDATFSDDRVTFLTNDSLLFGNLSNPFYSNNSFSAHGRLLDIIKFDDLLVLIRCNTEGAIAFYSILYKGKENTDLESCLNETEKDIFGGLAKNESYVDYIKYENYLVIASNSKICTYKLVSDQNGTKKFVCTTTRKYTKHIFKFGTFRNYFYIQFCEEIQFFYPSCFVTEEELEKCNTPLKPIFVIANSSRIMSSAFSNQLIAFAYSKKSIAFYSFDDFNEKMIPFAPPFQSTETITSISIISETVIFGTSHGNIFSLDLIPDVNGNSLSSNFEIVVKEGFSTDEKIVKMVSMNNGSFIMAATVSGMAFKIEKFKEKHPKFYDLYRVLSLKHTSVGMFRKEYQRCPKANSYLVSIMQMCDMDLLNSFAALNENEKKVILSDSGISYELAEEILHFEAV